MYLVCLAYELRDFCLLLIGLGLVFDYADSLGGFVIVVDYVGFSWFSCLRT